MGKRRSAAQIAAQKKAVAAKKAKRDGAKNTPKNVPKNPPKFTFQKSVDASVSPNKSGKKLQMNTLSSEDITIEPSKELNNKLKKEREKKINRMLNVAKTSLDLFKDYNIKRNNIIEGLRDQMRSQPYMPFGNHMANKFNEMISTHKAYELKRMQTQFFDMPTIWKEAAVEQQKAISESRKYNEQLINNKAAIQVRGEKPIINEYGEEVKPPSLDTYFTGPALRIDLSKSDPNDLTPKDKTKFFTDAYQARTLSKDKLVERNKFLLEHKYDTNPLVDSWYNNLNKEARALADNESATVISHPDELDLANSINASNKDWWKTVINVAKGITFTSLNVLNNTGALNSVIDVLRKVPNGAELERDFLNQYNKAQTSTKAFEAHKNSIQKELDTIKKNSKYIIELKKDSDKYGQFQNVEAPTIKWDDIDDNNADDIFDSLMPVFKQKERLRHIICNWSKI